MNIIFPHPLIMCVYLVILIFIIKKSQLFYSQFYTKSFYLFLFIAKIIIGLFGFYFLIKYTHTYDTKCFINEAETIVNFFFLDKSVYFRLVFGLNDFQPEPPELLPYIDQLGFWYDYSSYFMVRILAVLLPLCLNDIFILYIVFSFITTYFIYIFFEFIIKNTSINEVLLPLLLFIIPGFLFWNSQIHKDAVIAIFYIVITYATSQFFSEKKYYYIMAIAASFYCMFFLRYYTFFMLIPAWLSWVIATSRRVKRPIALFAAIYVVFIVLAFLIDVNYDNLSLIKEITIRQDIFINNWGNTSYPLKAIDNSLGNLLLLLPYALINSFIHPFFGGCKNIFCHLNSIETLWIIILLVFLLSKVNYMKLLTDSLSCYFLFFSLSITTLSGLIVNNGGAIARYRSLSVLLIVIALFNHIELYKTKDK